MTDKPKKIAVVLFNLGGPTGVKTIRPFLQNFFMDKNIIPFPSLLRYGVARLISNRRGKGPALDSYNEMGGSSPLLENTLAQARALQPLLSAMGEQVRVYTCMRYWHPMAESVVAEVQAFQPDELFLVSLYPQQSSTTFWSSLQQWQAVADAYGYTKEPAVICCYPTDPGFIKASAKLVRAEIEKCHAAIGRMPRVLFSAHSLPVKVIKQGDPYQYQCELTVKAIVEQLAIPDLDYRISYQSKVGPQEWLGPQTEDEIKQAGADNVPLIIYPHAFVSEHVETIVELGVEYKHVADDHGVPYYGVVQTVGTHPDFIQGLAKRITDLQGRTGMFSDSPDDGKSICPPDAIWCCQRRAKNEKIILQG
ncbi:MAG TPA: ferrochelatase [Alphaproteobacteria bacterium]